MRLYPARVGKSGDTCDRCNGAIPPYAPCAMAGNGMLYCDGCALALGSRRLPSRWIQPIADGILLFPWALLFA